MIRDGILTGLEKAALAEDLQREVEERKATEQSLLASRKRLTDAQRIAGFGNWEWDIQNDVIEYRMRRVEFSDWSPETFRSLPRHAHGAGEPA